MSLRRKPETGTEHRSRFPGAVRPVAYAAAAGVVVATVIVAFMANQFVSHASLSLLFLAGVLVVSARTGLGPSLLSSLLSFLALNFFFTQPYYTLEVAHGSDVAMLLFFLMMATVTGNLAARMRREVVERRASLQRTSNLYEFSRRMASAAGTEAVLDALADHLARSIARGVLVFATESDKPLQLVARSGPEVSIPEDEVRTMWMEGSADMTAHDSGYAIKLSTSEKAIGMVIIHGGPVDQDHLELARSLCDQATVALSRTRLVMDLEEARLTAETEQLRSALLSSVSHDLRTPLASIIGSTTSLLEYGGSISEANRHELLSTVVDEAKRLDRHIQNLLDMTRLGQGRLKLRRDWVDLNDIVSSAVDRVHDTLKGCSVDIDIAGDVPLLWVHGTLVEQALVNILDNAIRFSPVNGRISVRADSSCSQVTLEVCDQGPGIPDVDKDRIFDMFYTSTQSDRDHRQGTGLGLAICRGIVTAHGGTVTAHDGSPQGDKGACIRIVLPGGREDGVDCT